MSTNEAIEVKFDFTLEQWQAEAVRRFGKDPMGWKFICPACKWIASVQDWKDAGASEGEAAISCIGRRKPIPTQCNYAGYGLFRLNPVNVLHEGGNVVQAFDFAPENLPPDNQQPTKLSSFR